MERCVVTPFDILESKGAVSVEVDLLESTATDFCAETVHRTHDNSNELVEIDGSVVVVVKCLEKAIDVFGVDFTAEVSQGFGELILVKSARIIIVKYLKLPRKSGYRTTTAFLQLIPEPFHKDSLEARYLLWSFNLEPLRRFIARLSPSRHHLLLHFSLIVIIRLLFFFRRYVLKHFGHSRDISSTRSRPLIIEATSGLERVILTHLP